MGIRTRSLIIAVVFFGMMATLLVTGIMESASAPSGFATLTMIFSGAGLLMIMVGAFMVFQGMIMPLENIARVSKRYAKGDFRERFDTVGIPEVDDISTSFNAMADNMRDLSRELRDAVLQLQASSGELENTARAVFNTTMAIEERSANNATASEEMSVTIENVARHAEDAAKGATNARQLAERGSTAVEATLIQVRHAETQIENSATVVSQLSDLSNQIGIVVRFISDIADETNLLALNAAIEAARAGEHGRGFAVVADEVRKLAEATMNSTKEISGTVKSIQQGTARAKSSMDSVRTSIGAVSARAHDTTGALDAIERANRDIENMVLSISTASEEQSTTSADMARNIEETAQQAHVLSGHGSKLSSVATHMIRLSATLADFATKVAEGHSDTVSYNSSQRSGSSVQQRERDRERERSRDREDSSRSWRNSNHRD